MATVVTYIFMDGSQFYQWLFYIPDRPYYPIENALYAPLHKVLWSAGICAIIIVSITTGFGEFLFFKTYEIISFVKRSQLYNARNI